MRRFPDTHYFRWQGDLVEVTTTPTGFVTKIMLYTKEPNRTAQPLDVDDLHPQLKNLISNKLIEVQDEIDNYGEYPNDL